MSNTDNQKGTLACGKSTIDGSYVKGILKQEVGKATIDDVPVHPWSVGIIFGKIKPFKLKTKNDG